MTRPAFITTSWDDGNPADLRIAELLARYQLPGTFYIPRESEFGTMSASQVRELSANFEIGAHTLHHAVLPTIDEKTAWSEIAGSKQWVQETTGRECVMFCAPQGKFSRRHLTLIAQAGFSALRGVDLLSLCLPRPRAGLLYMPTTIQAYPHSFSEYVRNGMKRGNLRTLCTAWRFCRSNDWLATARILLERHVKHGGVFHLWGHSWEIEQLGLWNQLEDMMRMLSKYLPIASTHTNGDLCRMHDARRQAAPSGVAH